MERRLTSCVAYALRISYKINVPSVTEHLTSALHCVRKESANHIHPDGTAAQRQIIRLFDASPTCQTQQFADASMQTEANICTELECKAVAEGVLKTAQVQIEKLRAQTELVIQEREATIRRLESDLDSRICQVQAMVHDTKASSGIFVPEAGTTAWTSSAATSNVHTPIHESTSEIQEGNQLLIDHHRKQRMELKQRRRSARLQRLREFEEE
ncbi:rbcL [Symbiodinium sp. CCMP2592]|nr:rbcL [Symbiodinium sp. CCMP2592]